MRYAAYILIVFSLSFCGKSEDIDPSLNGSDTTIKNVLNDAADSLTFLALGDSYTIGQGVLKNDRWPVQLAEALRSRDMSVGDPFIVAKTGWTTRNLRSAVASYNLAPSYDMVSLLIGVNNQFQGLPFDMFKAEFLELLDYCKEKAKSRSGIFVLSIPDYGVTPFGQSQEQKISLEIDMYNAWIKATCSNEQIKFYDITETSRKAKYDRDLLADDNLHPSSAMYALWVETILADPPALLRN